MSLSMYHNGQQHFHQHYNWYYVLAQKRTYLMASKLHNGCLQRRGARWSLKGIMMCITTCQEQVRHVVMSTLLTAGIRAVRVCWSPLNTGTRSCLDRLASMSAPLPPSSPNGRFIEIGNAILNEPKYRVLKELIFVALSHTFAYKIACCFLGCFRVPEPVPELNRSLYVEKLWSLRFSVNQWIVHHAACCIRQCLVTICK